MIKDRIDQDLKAALLSGDKDRATVLRGIKSAILYEEVAKNAREAGLADDAIIIILQREAKKRQESADLYVQGGSQDRANQELAEKKIIEAYLPAQLDEAALKELVEAAVAENGDDKAAMGKIIASVKDKAAGAADGATIARLVKERLGV